MQIVICDDVPAERQTLREHIYYCGNALALDYVIEEFESARPLLAAMRSDKICPDILFLDIYMDGITGMAAAKLLLAEGYRGALIFTTTSKCHAIESYEIMADGYLVKPYSKEIFYRNFQRATQRYAESFKTLSFPCNRMEVQVLLKDVEYIESDGRGSMVCAKNKMLKTSKSVSAFAQELAFEANFLRSHQGCIVNLHFVATVEEDFILMKSGAKALLTLRNRQAVRKAAADYFFMKMRED